VATVAGGPDTDDPEMGRIRAELERAFGSLPRALIELVCREQATRLSPPMGPGGAEGTDGAEIISLEVRRAARDRLRGLSGAPRSTAGTGTGTGGRAGLAAHPAGRNRRA